MRGKYLLLSSGVLTLASFLNANAQEVPVEASDAESVSIQERVIVTAQRRDQSAEDVPVSLTAITAEAIDAYQIDDVGDYAQIVPNLGYTDGGSPSRRDLSIRGVTDFGGSINAVAVYIDEINVSPARLNSAVDPKLVDVERIEVLRGPQGTLFGRNAVAGAVSITTAKPDADFRGRLSGSYSSFNTFEGQGSINIPFSDQFFVRAAGFYGQSDGFIDNRGAAGGSNDYENTGGRLALRFLPSNATTVDLSVSYSDLDEGLIDQVPTGVSDAFFSVLGFPIDPAGDYLDIGFAPQNSETVVYNQEQSAGLESLLISGRIEQDFGNVVGIVTAGYIESDARFLTDNDRTSIDFAVEDFRRKITSSTFEARLQSDGGETFSWITGLSYADDESSDAFLNTAPVGFFEFFGVTGVGPGTISDETLGVGLTSIGVFADATWTVLDGRMDISAGARLSQDEVTESSDQRDTDDVFAFTDPLPVFPARFIAGSQTFEHVTGRLSAVYRATDRLNLYATISRGTRPGGFNLAAIEDPDLPDTYDTEVLINYEAGIKGSAFNRGLVYSAAAFIMDYSDIQAQSVFFPPGTTVGSVVTLNAGKAESLGFEAEFSAVPFPGFTLNGGIGYQDATFGAYTAVDDFGSPVDASGNRLPLSSKWTANLGGEYRTQISSATEAFFRGEFSYRSDYFEGTQNLRTREEFVDDYEVVNLRAGISQNDLTLTVFGENLTEEFQIRGSRGSRSALAGIPVTIVPRIFGIRLTKDF